MYDQAEKQMTYAGEIIQNLKQIPFNLSWFKPDVYVSTSTGYVR